MSYCCPNCNKTYKMAHSLERHKVLCGFTGEETPTYEQLVNIVVALYKKQIQLETTIETLKHSHAIVIHKKQFHMDILSYLNNQCEQPTINFDEWSPQIKVEQTNINNLFDNTIFTIIQDIWKSNINKSIQNPIRCFTHKPNTFYIYTQTDETLAWREMNIHDICKPLKTIQKNLIIEFTTWGNQRKTELDKNDRLAEKYRNLVKKIIDISFTDDVKMSKVKNNLFNIVKEKFIPPQENLVA